MDMTNATQGRYWLLLRENKAMKKAKSLFSSLTDKKSDSFLQVLPGSIWELKKESDVHKLKRTHHDPHFKDSIVFCSVEDNDITLRCQATDMAGLEEWEYKYLVAIPQCSQRYKVHQDRSWINEIFHLDVNFRVIVEIDNPRSHAMEKASGVLRYVGELPDELGIWFGIELDEKWRGCGSSDGEYRKTRLFGCDKLSAVFVPINKLRALRNISRHTQPGERKSNGVVPNGLPVERSEVSTAPGLSPPPLNIGERVVWVSDRGPESGTVEWIGIIPEAPKEWTVGVNFDNAVGSGTGKHNDSQLFKSRPNHASLIPILGLIKADEFYQGAEHDLQGDLSLPNGVGLSGFPPPPTESELGLTVQPSRIESRRSRSPYDRRKSSENLLLDGAATLSLHKTVRPGQKEVVDYYRQSYRTDQPRSLATAGAYGNQLTVRHQTSTSSGTPPEKSPLSSPQSPYQSSPRSVHRPATSSQADENGHLYETLADAQAQKKAVSQGNSFDRASPSMRASQSDVIYAKVNRSPPMRLHHTDGALNHRVPTRDSFELGSSHSDSPRGSRRSSNRPSKNSSDNTSMDLNLTDSAQAPGYSTPAPSYSRPAPGYSTPAPGCSTPAPGYSTPAQGCSTPAPGYSTPAPGYSMPTHNPVFTELPSPCEVSAGNSLFYVSVKEDRSAPRPKHPVSGGGAMGGAKQTTPTPTRSQASQSSRLSQESPVSDSLPSRFGGLGSPGESRVTAVALQPGEGDAPFGINTMVEIPSLPVERRYGVIRWVGRFDNKPDVFAGLEMEEEYKSFGDGAFCGLRLFHCPSNKAFFIQMSKLKPDSRFVETMKLHHQDSYDFGSLDCPDVVENATPRCLQDRDKSQLQIILGLNKGIQGHHNSCYLDATLFAMFSFSTVFDMILHRPRKGRDIEAYDDVQTVLRQGIVNPLRKKFYVRADKVLKLRKLLDQLGSIPGMMTEEKDPEEFLTSLLDQTMKVEPFITLSSGQQSYLYQLFIESKDCRLNLPTTQQLLELSFLQADIKLRQEPRCLILQMPRFGKEYKMYSKIIPSLYLDITDILEYGPRECYVCGKVATYECMDCFKIQLSMGHKEHSGLSNTSFCEEHCKQYHSKRSNHKPRPLERNKEYSAFVDELHKSGAKLLGQPLPRVQLELFAVICIQTSHYVSFVKCGSARTSPWIFFDSMADRKGQQNGYNIPEVSFCSFLPEFLLNQDEYLKIIDKDPKSLEDKMRRLCCDAYICMYQNTQLLPY